MLDERDLRIRPRDRDDLPALAAALLSQQAQTRYPFRNPLPIPVEEFLHADDAAAAWTATVDERPVGHVCRTGPGAGFPAADAPNEAGARAHGCPVAELAWVSSLFVAAEARGLGIARGLVRTVVDDIRKAGLRPCLEVLSVHAAARSLYLASGWRDVHEFRPEWLVAAAGDEHVVVHVMVLIGSST